VNNEKYRAIARQWWRQEIRPILILALVLFSIRSSLADWNDVPTGSMKPTILEGDRVFVNKLAYDLKVPFTTRHITQWGNPRRGDIVVFYSPKDGQRLVKRFIGLPGDTVELRNERLVLNGQPVDYAAPDPEMAARLSGFEREHGVFATEELPASSHAVMAINGVSAMRTFGPVQVPDGHYFMMGDNRDNSYDSRYFGTVPRGQIVGRATTVVISINKENHWLPRWNRTVSSLENKTQ
jgi:signal peptidase I